MKNSHLISYLTLRKTLGILGIILPVILPFGVFLFSTEKAQDSISHYYYTVMGDVFVGILWAFGLFLFTYEGYRKTKNDKISDNVITNIAGILAIGIALFPTHPHPPASSPGWIGAVHLICAALFFLILGGISLFIFTKSPLKKKQNRVYKVCGWIIWLCLLILLVYFLFFQNSWPRMTVYWVELVMLWAFGMSWIVKGKALKRIGL